MAALIIIVVLAVIYIILEWLRTREKSREGGEVLLQRPNNREKEVLQQQDPEDVESDIGEVS